jgi:hypothetical protein
VASEDRLAAVAGRARPPLHTGVPGAAQLLLLARLALLRLAAMRGGWCAPVGTLLLRPLGPALRACSCARAGAAAAAAAAAAMAAAAAALSTAGSCAMMGHSQSWPRMPSAALSPAARMPSNAQPVAVAVCVVWCADAEHAGRARHMRCSVSPPTCHDERVGAPRTCRSRAGTAAPKHPGQLQTPTVRPVLAPEAQHSAAHAPDTAGQQDDPVVTLAAWLRVCVDAEAGRTRTRAHAWCQVSGVRWQVAGVRWQVSGVRWQVAGGRWQVSGVRWQVAGGRWQVCGGGVPGSRGRADAHRGVAQRTCRGGALHAEGVPPAGDVEAGRRQWDGGGWQLDPVGQVRVICVTTRETTRESVTQRVRHRDAMCRWAWGEQRNKAAVRGRAQSTADGRAHALARHTHTWVGRHSQQLFLDETRAGVVCRVRQAVRCHRLCIALEVDACVQRHTHTHTQTRAESHMSVTVT